MTRRFTAEAEARLDMLLCDYLAGRVRFAELPSALAAFVAVGTDPAGDEAATLRAEVARLEVRIEELEREADEWYFRACNPGAKRYEQAIQRQIDQALAVADRERVLDVPDVFAITLDAAAPPRRPTRGAA